VEPIGDRVAPRRLVPVAGVALSGAAGLSFTRVFDSGRFVVPMLGAAIAATLIGVISRQLRIGVAGDAVFSLLALFGYLLIIQRRGDLARLGDWLRAGWRVTRTGVSPVPVDTGTILLVVIGTWIVAGLVDWLACKRDATTGALAPPLMLFVLGISLGSENGSGIVVSAVFALAAVIFLLIQHRALLARRRGAFAGKRVRSSTGLLGAGMTLGICAVLAGAVVAPLVPGASADPLLDYRLDNSTGGDTVYEPQLPTIDVGDRLRERTNAELFRVKSSQAQYWRLAALDVFEGNWTLRVPELSAGLDEQGGSLRQDFSIGPLGARWMPAAFEPRRVDGGDPRVAQDSLTLVTEDDSVTNLDYTVYSDPPQQLAAIEADPAITGAPAVNIPADIQSSLDLPPQVPAEVTAAAQRFKAAGSTPYEQARALRDWFRDSGEFTYDATAQFTGTASQDGMGVVAQFVDDKRGFCVQFASAYALIAREMGIPARLAVGFTPGSNDGDEWVVGTWNAHAWPEVWLPELGWTNVFDPTPASDGVQPGGSALPGDVGAPAQAQPPPNSRTDATTTTSATSVSSTPTTTPAGQSPPPTISVGGQAQPKATSPWRGLFVLPIIAALGAMAYAVIVLSTKRRSRERRRRAEPRAAVVGAWTEALDRLAEAGIEPSPLRTPQELAFTVRESKGDPAGAALDALAGRYGQARYAAMTLDQTTSEAAWSDVADLERALDASVGTKTRWRRRLALPRR